MKLGIEADYFPGYEEDTRRLIDAYPFDYVFGSIHFLDDWHFTSKAGRPRFGTEDPDEAFQRYFELLGEMIGSGLFDIVAHPDAIRKEHFRPSRSMEEEYRTAARSIRGQSMSIEVNTAGLRRGAGSVYPDPAFLRPCVEEGVSVTLGSDAHHPDDVGRDFDAAFEALRAAGIDEIATYEGRRLVRRPLSSFIPT